MRISTLVPVVAESISKFLRCSYFDRSIVWHGTSAGMYALNLSYNLVLTRTLYDH